LSRLRLAKIAAPSSPPSSTAELFYSTTDSKLEAIDESGNIAVLGGFTAKDYRLLKVAIVTASGTYTPTAGARALYVECVGGGGAGGGATVTTSNGCVGGGGGSGAYSAVWLIGAAVKTSYSVTVGGGGTGVSAGNGNNGADTTFDSPSVSTAKGGTGGLVGSASTTPGVLRGSAGGASSGGVGDLKADGNAGGYAILSSGTAGAGGPGGASAFGGSPFGPNAAGAGTAAGNYGAGGAGALSLNTSAQTGGNGANGLIRVWEFA
jgi:hypothetical protein